MKDEKNTRNAPVAKCYLKQIRKGLYWIVDECPRCGKYHKYSADKNNPSWSLGTKNCLNCSIMTACGCPIFLEDIEDEEKK
jgi:hypothetical protein